MEEVRILVQELLESIQVLLDGNKQVIIHIQLLEAESTVTNMSGHIAEEGVGKYKPELGYLVLPKRPDEARKIHDKSFSATAEDGTPRAFACNQG